MGYTVKIPCLVSVTLGTPLVVSLARGAPVTRFIRTIGVPVHAFGR